MRNFVPDSRYTTIYDISTTTQAIVSTTTPPRADCLQYFSIFNCDCFHLSKPARLYIGDLSHLKMVYTLTVHLYANDKPDSIERIKAKLIEAARIYRKDKETVNWFVMQDVHDPRAFTIVERFESEGVSFLSSVTE